MKTAIITIGDEILIGQIVDTNSAWMANILTQAGFEVEEKVAIGDNAQQIKDTIDDVSQRVDVILMTGGLGPTKDDITKNTLCEYFDTTLIFNDLILENIRNLFPNRVINELTRNQAYVPKDCTVIQNKVGTAPITWFDYNGKVLVSMPGVPHEMKYVMENEIIPRLQAKYQMEAYVSKVLIVGGYSESGLAMYLNDFENNLPRGFGLAYLPSLGIIKLRLFVKGESRRTEFNEQAKKLETLLGEALLWENDIAIEKILGERLFAKGLTLGTAESCTGGNIAHMITSIPGSSKYYNGSVVSYSNEIKTNILGVLKDSLNRYGAVSEEVATEMAIGAKRVLDADCIIAVTGIAGPDGGTEEKPVGTLWVSTIYNNKHLTKKYMLSSYRETNIIRSSNIGMMQLIGMMEGII